MTPQIEAFLEMMAVERDASPHTLSAYGRDLADAETWLGDAGGLMSAPQEALEAWFADLSRRGLSAATAARRRAPLPEPVPARQITGRSLIVVAVLLVAAVLVAPTLRAFLNQQLEISAAREEIAAMQAQREDYERRIQLWDDPAYVTQQARERLELVMPGETLYSVTGRPSETDTATETEDTPAAGADEVVNTRLPWAEGLWDSAVRAGLE